MKPPMSEQDAPDVPQARKDLDDWWPCVCVRRDRKGNLKSIKLHSPFEAKCRVCKVTREEVRNA